MADCLTLEDSIENVESAVALVKGAFSEQAVKQLNEEVAKAKHVAKSMRAFT